MNGNDPGDEAPRAAGGMYRQAFWRDVITLSIAALALYHLGPLLVLFIVPMQVLVLRRGEHGYRTGILIFLGGEVAFKAVSLMLFARGPIEPLLVSLDVLLPLSMLAGLFVLNRGRLGTLTFGRGTGVFIAAVVCGAVSLPLVIYLGSSKTMSDMLAAQFRLAQQLGILPAAAGDSNMGSLITAVIGLFYRLYLFGLFVLITGGWYLGTRFERRARAFRAVVRPAGGAERGAGAEDGVPKAVSVRNVSLPSPALWILLVSWVGVLAGRFVSLGPFIYAFWNFALIGAFLYAVQGVGIILTLLDRTSAGRGIRIALSIAGIVLLFVPVANVVLAIGLPLFGVSKTWVRYRSGENPEG